MGALKPRLLYHPTPRPAHLALGCADESDIDSRLHTLALLSLHRHSDGLAGSLCGKIGHASVSRGCLGPWLLSPFHLQSHFLLPYLV